MYPKASPSYKKVMDLANDMAHEYDQEYVGTEHVLMAILSEGDGIGARVLIRNHVTPVRLKAEIDKLIRKSMEETWVFGRLPGTPHFKNVAATAIEQCQQLDGKEVGTEHLLLALLKERGCVANKALKELGLSYEKVKEEIIDLMQ